MLERSIDLKRRLKSGQPTFGVWLTIPNLDVAEMVAHLGYDWVLIDAEHAPFDLITLQSVLVAFNGSSTVPMVRVASQDPTLIKHALDLGAEGIVIPQVESEDEVRRSISAMKYPPHGSRGFGPRRASRYLSEVEGYLNVANDAVLVVVQIESMKGVNNLNDIIAVPGIDVVFAGPMDLSISYGVPRDINHPVVIDAIDTVINGCRSHGIAVCAGLSSAKITAERARRGANFILTGTDHQLFQDAALAKLNELKSSISATDQ